MAPTFRTRDYFTVDRGAYLVRKPARGDIVLAQLEPDRAIANDPGNMLRVMGLPGDVLEFRGRQLIINGEEVRLTSRQSFDEETGASEHIRVETLPTGLSHLIYAKDHDASEVEFFVVPQGHYFLLGDNRRGATDSSTGIPPLARPVPASAIAGRVFRREDVADTPLEWLDRPAPKAP